MRINNPFLLAGILVFAFISCQKEVSTELPNNNPGNTTGNGNGNNSGNNGGSSHGSELGNWKFISLHATVLETAGYKMGADAVKAVTTTDYVTDDNAGTIKFDGSNMAATGLTYSVNGVSTTNMYTNNVLLNTFQMPLTGALPASDATVPYKKIGTDSIYLQNSALTAVGSSGTIQTTSAGYKLRFYSDTMTMTSVYDDAQTIDASGVSTKISTHLVSVVTLKKM
jgi:hypothetical protein